MWFILTFVVNSGLNFLLSLAVAAVLGPEEFGRFAVASMAAVVATTLLFDWLRLSATRFYASGGVDRATLRSSLDGGYLGAGLLLGAATLAVVLFGLDTGLAPVVVILAAATAATSALFEYGAALARALFLNRIYGRLVLLKSGLAFATMIAAGWLTGSPAWVLGMFSASTLVAVLAIRSSLADPAATLGQATRAHLAAFARYGWPIVAANLAYQAILLVNRVAASGLFGYAAAGQLSLATDVTIRILLSAGGALDVFLFQLAVRRTATDGMPAANQQVARNMILLAAVLTGLAMLFWAAMPAFQALVVPPRYRDEFGPIGLALLPGALALCLVQYALSPVFQLARRTWPVLLSALAAAFADFLALVMLPRSGGLVGIAWAHSAALCLGFAVAALLALRVRECRPSLRDVGVILFAAAAVGLMLWPLRGAGQPWLILLGVGLVGTPLYGSLLLAGDVAGARDFWRGLRARLGVRPSRDLVRDGA